MDTLSRTLFLIGCAVFISCALAANVTDASTENPVVPDNTDPTGDATGPPGGATDPAGGATRPNTCDEEKEDINHGLKTAEKNCKNQTVMCHWGHCWVPVPEHHEDPVAHWVSTHWDIFVVLGIVILSIIIIIYLVMTDKDSKRVTEHQYQQKCYPAFKSKSGKCRRTKKRKSSQKMTGGPVVILIDGKSNGERKEGEVNPAYPQGDPDSSEEDNTLPDMLAAGPRMDIRRSSTLQVKMIGAGHN